MWCASRLAAGLLALLAACAVPSRVPEPTARERITLALEREPGIAPAVPVELPGSYRLLDVGAAAALEGVVVARTTTFWSAGAGPPVVVCTAATAEDLGLCGTAAEGASEPFMIDGGWAILQYPGSTSASDRRRWSSVTFTTNYEQVGWIDT